MSLEVKVKLREVDLNLGEQYANIDYALSKMIVFKHTIVPFCNNTLILSAAKAFNQQSDGDDEIPALEDIADNALGVGLAGRKVRAKL